VVGGKPAVDVCGSEGVTMKKILALLATAAVLSGCANTVTYRDTQPHELFEAAPSAVTTAEVRSPHQTGLNQIRIWRQTVDRIRYLREDGENYIPHRIEHELLRRR